MKCPHCQQSNEALRSDAKRTYYQCARCDEIYWGPPALASPTAAAPSQAQARPRRKLRPKPDYRPTPFERMTLEQQAAIRALLSQVEREGER